MVQGTDGVLVCPEDTLQDGQGNDHADNQQSDDVKNGHV